MAVDCQDNILVADWGNSRWVFSASGPWEGSICHLILVFRIQVFDQFGSFLSYVNTGGCPLYGPQGLAITPEPAGHVVVADSGNHCVKVYKYLQ